MRKLVFCCFTAIFLLGCNSTQNVNRLPLQIPDSPEIKMRTVNWEIQDSKICLSPEMYSNLSLNTQDIMGLIQYQNKVIEMYKDYYHESENFFENDK